MKIKRQALITILQARLDEREKDRVNRHNAALNTYAAEEREYAGRTHEAWKNFADRIHHVLDRGDLVTRNDIPKAIHSGNLSGLKFFEKRKPLAPTPSEEELQLRRLIEILKNSTDIEVSTYALEKMGFPLGRVIK